MKRVKRIFIVSIILLLLITSVLVAAAVHENTYTSLGSVNGNNSLGILQVTHGGNWSFIPPPENTIYYFCEKNGTVLMNFTLEVQHRLSKRFLLPRYTLIDPLWISYKGEDYFFIFNETLCESEIFTNYTIYLTENMQKLPLETNGQIKVVEFWLNAGEGIGKFHLPMSDGTPWRFGRYRSNRHIADFSITIVPIPPLNS